MTLNALIEEYDKLLRLMVKQKRYVDLQSTLNDFSDKAKGLTDVTDEMLEFLATLVENPCRQHSGLWYAAAFHHLSEEYLPYLCTILEHEADCVHHEEIVDLLYEINDPRCVPSLAKALYYERSDDPTRELNIKILETLDLIGTQEAFDLIRNCLDHPSDNVRREAREILDDRGEGERV